MSDKDEVPSVDIRKRALEESRTQAGPAVGSLGLYQQHPLSFTGAGINPKVVSNSLPVIKAALDAHRKEIDAAQSRITSLEADVKLLKDELRRVLATHNQRPVLRKKGTA